MTPAAFVEDLRRRGIQVHVVGRHIAVSPPRLLTQSDRAALKEQRDRIVELMVSAGATRAATLCDALARVVNETYAEIDAWARGLGGIHLTSDLCRWLREVAPDLMERIRQAENEADEAVLAGDAARLDAALARWKLRWRAARTGMEYELGIRLDEDVWAPGAPEK